MKSIALTDIPGFRIGQVEDAAAGTGVTVIVAPEGMAASIDVRGGGPASRDTRILDPLMAAQRVHAVVLGGGSAYGLDAGGGVMRYLEEHGIGLPVMPGVIVPLVCQSDIFDLGVGSSTARPDAAMGYAACAAAFEGERGNFRNGNYGGGCGATVSKIAAPGRAIKAGIGSAAAQIGQLQVGAIVVLNACGDIYDSRTGKMIAGVATALDSSQSLYQMYEEMPRLGMTTNTAIGAVITNAHLTKDMLCKMAGMAHDGFARAIRPAHTGMDGDTIYGISVGDVEAPLDVIGALAADVMEEAIRCAVYSAEPAYGFPAATHA